MPTPSGRAILHIDWTKCDGRGLCTELVPDLFSRDKWGFPIAKTDDINSRSGASVPGSRLDAAADAVNMCPVLALRLVQPAAD